MKHNLAKIYLFIVAIIWGTGFAATSMAIAYYSPAQILALRFTIAFVALLLISHKRLKGLTKETLRGSAAVGVVLYLAFIFQTIGLQYTTVSKNAFLTAVNIVLVPLISAFLFKNKIKLNVWLGALITLIGIGVLSLTDTITGINKGDILTLICALFFALQIIATDKYSKEIATTDLMLIQMGTAALLSWATVIYQGEVSLDLSLKALMPVIYLGIASTLVAYYLQTYAQQFTTGTETAVILSTEAIFGMLSSVILVGEKVTGRLLIGAALIFVGILVVEEVYTLKRQRKQQL